MKRFLTVGDMINELRKFSKEAPVMFFRGEEGAGDGGSQKVGIKNCGGSYISITVWRQHQKVSGKFLEDLVVPEYGCVHNTYIKDTGDGRSYLSGTPFPRDADGVTRKVKFIKCEFHYASYSIFEDCHVDGERIPDGPVHLRYFLDLPPWIREVLRCYDPTDLCAFSKDAMENLFKENFLGDPVSNTISLRAYLARVVDISLQNRG